MLSSAAGVASAEEGNGAVHPSTKGIGRCSGKRAGVNGLEGEGVDAGIVVHDGLRAVDGGGGIGGDRGSGRGARKGREIAIENKRRISDDGRFVLPCSFGEGITSVVVGVVRVSRHVKVGRGVRREMSVRILVIIVALARAALVPHAPMAYWESEKMVRRMLGVTRTRSRAKRMA